MHMYIPGCGRYDKYTSRYEVYLFTLRDFCEMLLDKFNGRYVERSDMPVHTGYLLQFADYNRAVEFLTALANSPEDAEDAVTESDGKTQYILPHTDGNELPVYATTVDGINIVYIGLSEYAEALDQYIVVSKDVTPYPQDGTVLGKTVSDLQSAGTKVLEDGTVIGTLNKITGWTDFSSVAEEQDGNFFAFKLNTLGSTMTIKKNGVTREDKTNMPFDSEIVLRVSKGDKFTIEVDGVEFITLDFSVINLLSE